MSLPALMTLVLLQIYFGETPAAYAPYYSDEIYYWHEALDFSAVGFQGGYYTFEEKPAKTSFSRFDAHGPVFPMFYGALGQVFGWGPATGLYGNLFFFTAALAGFLALVRPDSATLRRATLVVALAWPLHLYMPSMMQESLHLGGAVLLAGVFYLLLERRDSCSPGFFIGSCLLLFFLSVLRTTWAFLWAPFFLASLRRPTAARLAWVGALSLPWMFAFFWLVLYWGAPFPYGILPELRELSQSNPGALWGHFWGHAYDNLVLLIKVDGKYLLPDVQQYLLLAVLAVTAYSVWKREEGRRSGLFIVYVLGSLLGFVIFFYELFNWGDYRVFAPVLLLCVFLSLASKRRLWIASLFVGAGLAALPAFSKTYRGTLSKSFQYPSESRRAFREAVAEGMRYRAGADPWCNTVLSYLTPWPFPPELAEVPAGIGISAVLKLERLALPPKSKYLLLDEKGYSDLKGKVSLSFLNKTEVGDLYWNLDSGCE